MALPNILVSNTLTANHIYTITLVLSPSEVAANTVSFQEFTVPRVSVSDGLVPSDQVLCVTKAADQSGLAIMYGNVSAQDKVKICFFNPTSSPVTPTANEAYTIVIYKPVMPITDGTL